MMKTQMTRNIRSNENKNTAKLKHLKCFNASGRAINILIVKKCFIRSVGMECEFTENVSILSTSSNDWATIEPLVNTIEIVIKFILVALSK